MSLPTITLCASHEPGDPSRPLVVSATARFETLEAAEAFAGEFSRSVSVRVHTTVWGKADAHLTVEIIPTDGRPRTGKLRRVLHFLHVAEKLGYPFEMRVDDADDYASPEALRAALNALQP